MQTRIGEEKNYLSAGLVNAVRKADSKLVFIPVMFVLLRIWGTVQFFYLLSANPQTSPQGCSCIHTDYYRGLIFLGVMQVSSLHNIGQGYRSLTVALSVA